MAKDEAVGVRTALDDLIEKVSLGSMKVGQHYYSTLLYLKMRAFGAFTGV